MTQKAMGVKQLYTCRTPESSALFIISSAVAMKTTPQSSQRQTYVEKYSREGGELEIPQPCFIVSLLSWHDPIRKLFETKPVSVIPTKRSENRLLRVKLFMLQT